jgi:hypothetical protein
MIRLSVRVNGDLVRQGLENLAAELPQIGRRRMRTIMERIKRRMQAYPPERMKSVRLSHPILGHTIRAMGYKRTGRLGRSWRISEINRGYVIENTASFRGHAYAGYVVGDAYGTNQAWMHAGRWEKFRDVTEEELKALPIEVEQEIIMVARREGL